MTFASRENRTLLLRPEEATAPKPRLDLTLVCMLGKSFYWQQRLDEGKVKDVIELAKQEKLDRSWINETLRLIFLAPDIVEAILRGHPHPPPAHSRCARNRRFYTHAQLEECIVPCYGKYLCNFCYEGYFYKKSPIYQQ